MFMNRRLASSLELFASNGLASLILFIGTYFVTQIVAPDTFGIYSLFLSIALTAYPVFSLRYDLAIPVAQENHESNILFVFSVVFSFAIMVAGLVVTALLYPFREILTIADGKFVDFGFLLWPACFALALFSIAQSVIIRAGLLKRLAISRPLRAVMVASAQIAMALLVSRGAQSLIIGELFANIIAAIIILWWAKSNIPDRSYIFRRLNNAGEFYRETVSTLGAFKAFPLVSLPHAFVHQAFVSAYAALFGAFYGMTILGQYFLMRKIIFGVTTMFSTAVYQVCVSEASKSKGSPERLADLYRYVVLIIGGITIPFAIFMVLFGEQMFSLIFGDRWSFSGHLAKAAFLLIVAEPIASAIAFIPVFMKRQVQAFLWSVAQNLAAILSLGLVSLVGGGAGAALVVTGLAVACVLLAYFVWLHRLCKWRISSEGC